MAETVIIRQNVEFETAFLVPDPHEPESDKLLPVMHLHDLTPYGMLLASLGACTAVILNTYAENHEVALEEVALVLSYERVFEEDCENCEEIDEYQEQIDARLYLIGDLAEKERRKLLAIARQCPIEKMLIHGIPVELNLVEPHEHAHQHAHEHEE
jgi:uncharacterized OsmC-like protein